MNECRELDASKKKKRALFLWIRTTRFIIKAPESG